MGRNHDPITLHKYLYANANPVTGIDPSGNMTMVDFGAAFTALGAITTIAYNSWQATDRFNNSATWSDDDWLRPNITGWLVLAAMASSSSGLLDKIADKVNKKDNQEYELYHGTDMQSGLALVNGAHISFDAATRNRSWSSSPVGFYLATDYGDAVHHANVTENGVRAEPAVVKYTFSAYAYRTITGISTRGPIPAGNRYRPAGEQIVVPPSGFFTFNRLMDSGEIRPGPP
jgi:hypothetical protein